MNREDVIRMAREAGLSNDFGTLGYPYLPELIRFANLVAAAEREACAKVAEESQRTRLTFDAEVIEMVKEAVEMEREACAEVAEQIEREVFNAVGDPRVSEFKPKIAAAIRARRQG